MKMHIRNPSIVLFASLSISAFKPRWMAPTTRAFPIGNNHAKPRNPFISTHPMHSTTFGSPFLVLYSTASSHTTNTDAETKSAWEEDNDDEDRSELDDDDEDVDEDNIDDEHDVEEEENDDDNEDTDFLQQEYEHWRKAIASAQKALEKKESSLENERTKAQKVEETQARAQLIVNNLYMFTDQQTTYTVHDWDQDGKEVELKLDPQYESPSAEADALFAQARKLKRGSQVIQTLLDEVQQAKQILQDCQKDLASSTVDEGRLRLVQDRLKRTASVTKFQEPSLKSKQSSSSSSKSSSQTKSTRSNRKPALGTPASNVRKLTTPHGTTVLVGRNRRGNEYLTFGQAKGNDIWMHARGTPGAHVLLLDRRGSIQPTDDCLQFAAHLAAFYSDGRTEAKVPVTVAEPKHLLKPRGAPLGAVKLRQEVQVLMGCPDLVPVELQEARAQSGVYASDEYRSADKAKHRKRTHQVQQTKQQKRRKQQQQQKRKRRNHYHKGEDD